MHQNAKLTPLGRAELVRRIEAGATPRAVATALGVSRRTVFKWLKRFRQEGEQGLQDRSSRPRRTQTKLSQSQIAQVELLRRQRWTGEQIALESGISRSTVFRTLHKLGLNRLKRLTPEQPPQRYEWGKPGQLIHIDIKKLGRITKVGHRVTGDRRDTTRGAGWEYVHVCVDDHSRIAFVEVMPDERKESAVAFLKAAVRYYARLGLRIERVMTDNGSCYISKAFRKACQKLGLRHIRTRPYTPRTNGKAERFIQTALREWAYAKAYTHSRQRNQELELWLYRYNWHRPHGGIGKVPPMSRSGVGVNNLMTLHS
jgi:transposase InsO family protein